MFNKFENKSNFKILFLEPCHELVPSDFKLLQHLHFQRLLADGVQDGIDSDQLHVLQVEPKPMGSHVVVRRGPTVAELRRVIGADGNGDAHVVVGDGWVLGEVVDVAQELVGDGAHLQTDVLLEHGGNEVGVLEQVDAVADPVAPELHDLADVVVEGVLGLSCVIDSFDHFLVLELISYFPYDGRILVKLWIFVLFLNHIEPNNQMGIDPVNSSSVFFQSLRRELFESADNNTETKEWILLLNLFLGLL